MRVEDVKLKPAMQNFNTRLARYARTWIWIISCNANLYPALLMFTVGFGVAARLGTIVGFVLSIKAAVWIFQPETIPPLFYEILPVDQQGMFAILILVPGLVFLLTGQFRYWHSTNALKLQTGFSNHFAREIILNELQLKTGAELSEKRTFVEASNSLRKTYARLFAVEGMLLDLLILIPVIIISLLVGLLINWLIVSVIMGLGFVLIAMFIWIRHQDRNELQRIETELQEQQINSSQALINLHTATKLNENGISEKANPAPTINSMINSMSKIREANQRFRFNSDLAMDMGQALIVIIFLGLLLNADIQSMQVQYLVILALLFRFIISYGKAIVQAILKLSPFYKFIVEFHKNSSQFQNISEEVHKVQ